MTKICYSTVLSKRNLEFTKEKSNSVLKKYQVHWTPTSYITFIFLDIHNWCVNVATVS